MFFIFFFFSSLRAGIRLLSKKEPQTMVKWEETDEHSKDSWTLYACESHILTTKALSYQKGL